MAPKDSKLCGNCKKDLPKTAGDFAHCKGCNASFHLDDCSVSSHMWKKLGKTGQDSWKCSSCKINTRKTSSSTAKDNKSDEEQESSDFEVSNIGVSKEILSKVTDLLTMKPQLSGIEKAVEFMAKNYDSLLKEVKGLREENKNLKKKVEVLEKKESDSREWMGQLESEVAELNQYGRRCNLEIHGLPVEGDPKLEDIHTVLSDVASEIGLDYRRKTVHKAHRLQQRSDGKPATVLVQFFSREVRDQWIQAGKRARLQGIYFNENLSAYYKQLLKDTKIKASACSYSYVWWQSGKILVRKAEGNRNVIVIKNRSDLSKLVGGPN